MTGITAVIQLTTVKDPRSYTSCCRSGRTLPLGHVMRGAAS